MKLIDEAMERFKMDCLDKSLYRMDWDHFCQLKTPKPDPMAQSFTTLAALAQVRFHNHPKTRARWL